MIRGSAELLSLRSVCGVRYLNVRENKMKRFRIRVDYLGLERFLVLRFNPPHRFRSEEVLNCKRQDAGSAQIRRWDFTCPGKRSAAGIEVERQTHANSAGEITKFVETRILPVPEKGFRAVSK